MIDVVRNLDDFWKLQVLENGCSALRHVSREQIPLVADTMDLKISFKSCLERVK